MPNHPLLPHLLIVMLLATSPAAASVPFGAPRFPEGPALDGVRDTVVADLDGDGNLDVVAAGFRLQSVAVFFADDADPPHFAYRPLPKVYGRFNAVEAADLDGDGDLDIAATTVELGSYAYWWENVGGDPATWPIRGITTEPFTGLRTKSDLDACDLDGDGDQDLAIAATGTGGQVTWYENDGSSPPAWSEHVAGAGSGNPDSVTCIDLDADGDLDLVTALASEDRVTWWESDGGTVPVFAAHDIATGLDGAYRAVVADVDGDDDLDVVTSAYGAKEVSWWESDGATTPSFAEHLLDAVDDTLALAVGDLDGDLHADIAYSRDPMDVGWWRSDGELDPSFAGLDLLDSTGRLYSIEIVDLDQDGNVDVLGTLSDDDAVVWWRGDGGAPPAFEVHELAGRPHDFAYSVTLADVDLDEAIDLVGGFKSEAVWWPGGERAPGNAFTTGCCALRSDVVAADLNGDGAVDLAIPIGRAVTATIEIAWDFGDPEGWSREIAVSNLQAIEQLDVADVDDDTHLDLVAALPDLDTVRWWENDGQLAPTWTPHDVTTSLPGATDAVAEDLDDDGDLDLVAVSVDGGSTVRIAWWESDGAATPTFTEHVLASSGTPFSRVVVGDVEPDGDLDLFALSPYYQQISWWENDGAPDPTFSRHEIGDLSSEAWREELALADLDGDGDLDVVEAIDDVVQWWENDGESPPAFTLVTPLARVDGVNDLAIGDVDADGDLDVAASAFDLASVAWVPSLLCDDLDGDGYATGAACPLPGPDCDDGDAARHPTAAEVCDGIDNDCDGVIPADELDTDGDGFFACEGDCDDTASTRNPAAPERCNGIDDDCDAEIPASEIDGDLDGYFPCEGDCDDADPARNPGKAEQCNGIDDDCNGSVPPSELDRDADGVRVCEGDCDDDAPTALPGGDEAGACDDGLDNDCDGATDGDDEDCPDTHDEPESTCGCASTGGRGGVPGLVGLLVLGTRRRRGGRRRRARAPGRLGTPHSASSPSGAPAMASAVRASTRRISSCAPRCR